MKKLISQFLAVIIAVCLCATVVTACEPTGETYTVTYVSGGGMGSSPAVERYTEGETFTVKAADLFTRDGYTFAGWSDGTNVVEAGSTYTMPAKNVIFTAQWSEEMQVGLEGKWSGCELDGEELLGIEGVTFNVTASVKKDGDNGVYVVLSLTGSLNNDGVNTPDNNNGQENQGDNNQSGGQDDNGSSGDNNNPEDNMNPDNNGNPEDNTNPDNQSPNPNIEMGEGTPTAQGEEETTSVTMSAAMWFAKDEEGNFTAEGSTVAYADGKLTISINFGSAQVQKLEFTNWAQLGVAPSVSGTYSATAENGDIYKVTFGENPEFTIERNQGQGDVTNPDEGNNGGDVTNPDEGNNGGDVTNPDEGNNGGDVTNPDEGNNGGDVTNPDEGNNGGDDILPGEGNNNGISGDMYDLDDNYSQNDIYMPRTLEENGDNAQNGGNDQNDNNGQTEDNNQNGGDQVGGDQNDNNGQVGGDNQTGDNDQTNDNIESFDVDKIVSVGQYWVVFVNEPIYDENGPTNQTRSIGTLVISAGENGTLVANTGEGESLIFTKAEQINA
ncbi:MAG: InlB B-repeat-containing protein [Clostridiales bacterium]|nr:InlB B-repeat-containing protein [Clostridiales bacterium]